MKKTVLTLLAAMTLSAHADTPIDALIHQMTLEEKFGQLQQLDGDANGTYRAEHPELVRKGLLGSTLNVRGAARTNELQRIAVEQSRMKIPVLFAFDVIHGYRTVFPVPLGEVATWDPADVELGARIAAVEAEATGLRWTFAPMVDIARDARWGRVVEGAGEDVFLGSVMARARTRGFQHSGKTAACAKHWVAYGAAEAGRDYNSVDVSERALRETYFPPFQAAVDEGVMTFMSSFNDVSGIPATANPFTLTQVLRNEWGFQGLVVSDYTAVEELIKHGVAADGAEAAHLALTSGCDMEMVSRLYVKHGPELVRSGKLDVKVVDQAVRRVLWVKERVGLFKDPYTDESIEARVLLSPEHRAAARRVAARSFVLLKNDRNVLPFSKNVKRVAVIGPLGDSQLDMIGSWSGDGRKEDAVTLLQGVRAKLPGARVSYVQGCDFTGKADIAAAVKAAREADVVLLAVGESAAMSGEASSRSRIDLPGRQLELIQAIHGTGKPYAVILMNGRPLALGWVADNCPSILETWFGGTEAGNAIADVVFGDVNPGGKLPITFPKVLGQVPIYYNHKSTGRPPDKKQKYTSKYLDVWVDPQYPFGHGLSYTRFALRDLKIEGTRVSATVQNVGRRQGDEVVQLYVQDVTASVARPVRELRGFQRVTLEPGESRTLSWTLGPRELGFLDRNYQWKVEPGTFNVWVGQSSVGGLQGTLQVP